MAKNKTTETAVNVNDFIHSFVDNEQKKQDSFRLMELMQEWTGFPPKMWGPSIIGFGSYHYKYASGHEGDAPIIAFSPRKAAFSLYVTSQTPENEHILQKLGKYKITKGCIYVKKLDDIDIIELNEAFAAQALAVMREWKFTDADHERTNVHGSGISLGHPVGATGGRMLGTLARELNRREAQYGLETMCIGGGQGLAAIFERVA